MKIQLILTINGITFHYDPNEAKTEITFKNDKYSGVLHIPDNYGLTTVVQFIEEFAKSVKFV